MKSFIQFLIEKDVYYRGIVGDYNPKLEKSQSLIFVTKNKEYAKEYAVGVEGDGELIKYNINVKNPFNFKYRTLSVSVKLKDVFSRIQVQLMELFEKGKLSEKKAIEIDDWFDGIKQKYKSQDNQMKMVWEWYSSIKEIQIVLKKMGHDAIEGNEGRDNNIKTYGVFNASQLKKI